MNYKTKYYSKIKSQSGTSYQVNLSSNTYTGNTYTNLRTNAPDPFILNYQDAGAKDKKINIVPSTADFSFYTFSGSTFDEIFTSNYRQWKLSLDKLYPTGLLISNNPASGLTMSGSGNSWTQTGYTRTVKIGAVGTAVSGQSLFSSDIGTNYNVQWCVPSQRTDTVFDGANINGPLISTPTNQVSVIITKNGPQPKAQGDFSVIYFQGLSTEKITIINSGSTASDSYVFSGVTLGEQLTINMNEFYVLNTLNGSMTTHASGSQTHSIGLTGSLIASWSPSSSISAGSSAVATGTPNSTFTHGTGTLAFVLNSAGIITTSTSTLKIRDNTTSTDYNGSVSGSGTNTVVVTFSLPAVANHSFTLSGSYTFSAT